MDEQALGDGLPNGTVVGEYEIEAVIGQGGFGVVYRARHRHLGTLIVLKEYLPATVAVRTQLAVRPRNPSVSAHYKDGLRRFREEAQRLVQFRGHRGVVTCLGFFEERGTAYLVMEYEEGMPLSELLTSREAAGRPLEQGELLRLTEQLLNSLATVHEAGVLHRDIKPSNILIRQADDWPVLIDFGAAKLDFERHTKSNAPHTQGYAAIEQLEAAGELGPWTDLYGLGAVLWRIVAGGTRPRESLVPVDAVSRMAASLRGQVDPLPSARTLGSGRIANSALEVIDKCLEVEPANRPSDCRELLGLFSVPIQEEQAERAPNGSADNVSESGWGEEEAANQSRPATEDRVKSGPRNAALRRTLVGIAATLMVLVVAGLLWYGGRSDRRGTRDSEPEVESVDLERLRELAEQHDPEAQRRIGAMYKNGDGVPRDNAEAAKWFRKAAEQDERQAQVQLGRMYAKGDGVPQDIAEAAKWYRKAAEQDDSLAQVQLGWQYEKGYGVPQDYAEAAKWYRKAAEQDDSLGQAQLGGLYQKGHGVPQDFAEAAKWHRKAAERGHGPSQFHLGQMYELGVGVPRDIVSGYAWTNLAAAHGLGPAERERDRQRSEMTATQIAEGQSLSRKIAAAIAGRDR